MILEIGLILLSIGIILTTIATLCYKHPKLNEKFILWTFGIGWFLMMVSAFFIGRYIVDELGWYII
jgi:hypothetical protein